MFIIVECVRAIKKKKAWKSLRILLDTPLGVAKKELFAVKGLERSTPLP